MVFDPSSLEIERVFAQSFGQGLRTVGITAPQWDSGTSSLARSLAARSALSGRKTLYMDLSGPIIEGDEELSTGWQPHLMGAGQAVETGGDEPYDRLILKANMADAMAIRDTERLTAVLNSDLIRYRSVVVDLAPLPKSSPAALPSSIGAAACEGVILTSLVGAVSRENVVQTVDSIEATGTKLLGLVLNDRDYPTLGQEMAREALRLRRIFPWLANSLARRALNSKMLNSRL
ncbi:hypothetical protein E1162_16715 [Rhodobacteraceae bacterium RKSG542]|uniref:hypothetical protein n=1 Tax=Pseudovibrio flavus TaxID=2529854 RepID=UPI0012BC4FB5|nr:hypothetical protein [Pseudovibrio flavus]MTI18887.1 hypothetical protein [Pseudovibrio flavus]